MANISFPGREVLNQRILELMKLINPKSDFAISCAELLTEYPVQKLLVGPEDELP